MTFRDKLDQAIDRHQSLLCVGLDPDPAKIPASLAKEANPVLTFNREIIAATADQACAFKPNFAFFGSLGPAGWPTLEQTLAAIPAHVPVILDAKVGDIGNTAEHYARMFLDRLGADALTVNPYMGRDAVLPFLARQDRGVFLLCLTSNPGAADFETEVLAGGGERLYERVARQAAAWNTHGNCGLVVGATRPDAMAELRQLAGDMPFLIPGVGAQGGDLRAAVEGGRDRAGRGAIVNVSRGVMYAGQGADFADAARRAAEAMRQEINQYRG